MHTIVSMGYQWNPHKARSNQQKHGIRFADAVAVFLDDFAITVEDEDTDEERFVPIGSDAFGRILVVVYTFRDEETRLISAREANSYERKQYEGGL